MKITMNKYSKYKYNNMGLKEYCKQNNISYQAVCKRIDRGYSVNDAVYNVVNHIRVTPKTYNCKNRCMIDGLSCKEYMEEYGVSIATFYQHHNVLKDSSK